MTNKCFCHLNGLAVKDATARAEIEKLKQTTVTPEFVNKAIETALENSINAVLEKSY